MPRSGQRRLNACCLWPALCAALLFGHSAFAQTEEVGKQEQFELQVPQVEVLAEDKPVAVEVVTEGASAGEWVVLPMLKSSPAIGSGVQVIAARFFKSDAESQPSVVGAGAGYFSSETWFAGVGGAYNFAADRWRLTGGIGYIDAKYDFYGVGTSAGNRRVALPIRQTGTVAVVKVLRSVGDDWYLGAGFRYLDSNVGLGVSLPAYPDIEDQLRAGVRVVSAGPTLSASYDTRDLSTNPRSGSYVVADALLASNSFASDERYQRYTIKANRYWSARDDVTLAGRIAVCGVSDDAPFFDLCMLGAGSDIRGYVAGQYQDRAMFSTQAEARIQLAPRWGGVLFAGVGQVAASFGDFDGDKLLPAGGFGLRWMAAPQNKVNLRGDLAWGKGGEALFYLAIGEAF